MSGLYRILLMLCLLPFLAFFVGCSTSLRYVEREASIDKEELANGWTASEGNHAQREHDLAADEILCRPVNVRAHEGYLVQIVNYSSDMVEITVTRTGLLNPTTASFIMSPMSELEHRLPAGSYNVHCSWGGYYSGEWDKVKEVRTSPVINNTSGVAKRFHAVIGNVDEEHRHMYQRYGY